MLNRLILLALFNVIVILSYAQEKRIALVIGNANYSSEAVLQNPINDALLMEITLKNLGFDVIIETDIETHGEFVEVIEKYNESRKRYNVGIVYYAGHAVQINGVNYMLATKEKYESESNIKYNGLDITIFTSEWDNVYNNELNILVLDACRNNPFEKKIYGEARDIKSSGYGLAEINRSSQPTGSLVAFSTAAGKTAADAFDGSKNSLYCISLCKNLQLEDVSIRNIFGKVSREIYMQTGQYPELSDKMFDVDFYLKKSTYQDEIIKIDSLIDAKAYNLARIKTEIVLTKSKDNKNALLRKGRIEYLTNGKKYDGFELYRASEIYPNDPEVYEYLSRYFSTIDEHEKAIEKINEAIKIDSMDADLFYWKARFLQKTNQYGLAESSYTKSIQLDFRNSKRYYDRALFYVNYKKEFSKALEDYNEAIRLSPSNLIFLNGRAILHKKYLLNNDKAIEDYEKILKIDSKNVNAINGIGLIYKDQGYLDLAVKQFNKGIELENFDKSAVAYCYVNRANIFAEQNKIVQALEDFTKAIELDSKNSGNYYNRALFYVNYKKEFSKALEDYNEAIRLAPSNLSYIYGRALLYKKHLFNSNKAIEDFEKILKIDSTNLNAINGIGVIYQDQGKLDLAIKQFNKGIELENIDKSAAAYCYSNRASIYSEQNNLIQALQDYTKSIELDSKNSGNYYNRALFYVNFQNDYSMALEDLNEAIRLDQNNLNYLNSRALLYKKNLLNNDKAIEDYEKILKLDSININAINGIGLIFEVQGKLDLAIEQFNKGIKLENFDKSAAAYSYSNRANIYSKQDKLVQALEDYTKAIELDVFRAAMRYKIRGDFYRDKLNRPYDALVDYSIAISKDRNNTSYLWTRGKLYSEKLNNQELAIQDFEQILKIKPNDINAMNWLTIFYDRNNNTENAINGYKKIISFGDSIKKLEYKLEDYGWANINLAEIYQCDRKIDEALALYNEGINYMPEYVKAYYWRSWFFALYMSKYDEAINDFATSIKLEPKNPHWYLNRSKIYQMNGDIKKATNDIDEAVKISNESAIYLAERGNFYSSINQHQKALTDFKKSANLDSTSRRLYHYITEDLIRQGKIEDAIKNAAITNKIFKNDTVSFEQLGRIYMAKNDLLKSLDSYTQAVSIMEFNEGDRTIYPHDIQVFLSDIYLNIAEIYSKLNQSDLECDTLKKAEEIIINETRPDRQKMIAEIQERLKKCQN
jgi:tetratricopeptide (TPR) repeat protein